MSEPIESVIPNSIANLACTIENSDGKKYNVTSNVISISIFESIFKHFIHAEVVMLDVSALSDTIPILGLEKFTIYFKKGDFEFEMDFFINGITERAEVSESGASYALYLSTREEILNSTLVYSKSYIGTNTSIINKIYKDSFGSSIDNLEESIGSINYILPMKRPIGAIKDLLSTAYDQYGSPFLLYQTLNGNGRTNLRSLVSLKNDSEVLQLDYGSSSTKTGESTREISKNVFRLNELLFRKGFDTYNNISAGAYGSTVNYVDLNKKYYQKKNFDYSKRAGETINGHSFTRDRSYEVLDDNLVINQTFTSKVDNYYSNELQYDNLFNMYGKNPYTKAAINSYRSRLDTQVATGFGNSIQRLESGSKVLLSFPKAMMTLSTDEDYYNDELISGVYLITAIRHYIKNEKYSMSYEFMREGVSNREEQTSNTLTRAIR